MTQQKASQATWARLQALAQEIVGSQSDPAVFGQKTAQYVTLLAQFQQERKAELAGQRAVAHNRVASAIHTLIASAKLEELEGEPVNVLRFYYLANDDGTKTPNISVNPLMATRKPKAPKAPGANGNGERAESRDLKAIFAERATPEDKALMAKLEAGVDPKTGQTFIGSDGKALEGAVLKKHIGSRTWALQNSVSKR